MKIIFALNNWKELEHYRKPELVSDDPEDYHRCIARERGQEVQICRPNQVLFALPIGELRRTIGIHADLRDYELFESEGKPYQPEATKEACFIRAHCANIARTAEAAKRAGLELVVSHEDDKKCTAWIDWVKPEFLRRKIGRVTMEDLLNREAGAPYADLDGNIFIKTEDKGIHGVCHYKNTLEVIGYNCEIFREKEPFFVSEPIDILQDQHGKKEWRIWMAYGKPTSFSRYLDYETNYQTPRLVESFAEAFGKAHPEAPAAYTLDVAETHDGVVVVELNGIEASGRYGKNDFRALLTELEQVEIRSLCAGLSIGTVLSLKHSEKHNLNITHAGPTEEGKYSGWILLPNGRALINSKDRFESPAAAEHYIGRVFTACQHFDLSWNAPKKEPEPITGSTPIDCPACNGEGAVDSGGVQPWGAGIDIPCGLCEGKGKTTGYALLNAGVIKFSDEIPTKPGRYWRKETWGDLTLVNVFEAKNRLWMEDWGSGPDEGNFDLQHFQDRGVQWSQPY